MTQRHREQRQILTTLFAKIATEISKYKDRVMAQALSYAQQQASQPLECKLEKSVSLTGCKKQSTSGIAPQMISI